MNKQMAFICLTLLAPLAHTANGGVLIWGSQSIQIPSLKVFNDDDFDLLKSYLRGPEVVVFRGDPFEIADELQELLKNKYTAFVPNSDLNLNGVIELNADRNKNFQTIREATGKNDNVLALLLSSEMNNESNDMHNESKMNTESNENIRLKRDVDETPSTLESIVIDSSTSVDVVPTEEEPMVVGEPILGPVLYKAQDKLMSFAMLYSSQTPTLRINDTTVSLGRATVETLDERPGKYRRLSVTLLTKEYGKVNLRFKFFWNGGYWNLTTVGLYYLKDQFTLTLSSHADLTASRNFSYHCTGRTVFKNDENRVELELYDLQVQPDATDLRFNDAYDCVNFTTVPIWSGLFVTYILLSVLALGLAALNSIKTMDKFDNYKTKQLTITTSE